MRKSDSSTVAVRILLAFAHQHPSVACGGSSPLEKRAAYRCPTAVPQTGKSAAFRFCFEAPNFALVFFAAQSRKTHQLMAPLCKGSSRGAGEGSFGKHRKTGRKFLFGTEKNTHSHRLPPRGSCRRRRLKESAQLALSCRFRFWR